MCDRTILGCPCSLLCDFLSVPHLPFTRALLRRVLWVEAKRKLDFCVGRARSEVSCRLPILPAGFSYFFRVCCIESYRYTAKSYDIAIVRACPRSLRLFLVFVWRNLPRCFQGFANVWGLGGGSGVWGHTSALVFALFLCHVEFVYFSKFCRFSFQTRDLWR